MNINSAYVNAYDISDIQSSSLERLSSSQAINKVADNPASLLIADQLDVQKSTLTQSLENVSSGIAMSSIAQDGISAQKYILENIKVETLKMMNGTTNQDQKDIIADQISQYVDEYEQIANSTNYSGETLLKTAGDTTDDISIVGDDTIVSISKADTTSISDTLKSFLVDISSNPESMQSVLSTVDQGLDKLATFASEYGSSSNALESMARSYIEAEKNTSTAKSTIMDIDYSKEVTNFSKSNLLTQIGYLMQTQANAQQQKNIALLS